MSLFSEIEDYLQLHQPELTPTADGEGVHVAGELIVYAQGTEVDRFTIRMLIPSGFPVEEPIVWELDERIPRTQDRHMNGRAGECCLTVWEAWRAVTQEQNFQTFMEGPVSDFFLGQAMVERGDDWPFSELPHGRPGIIQAYAHALSLAESEALVVAYLDVLSHRHIKGHFACPCGSGKVIRKCHRSEVEDIASRIDPQLAKKMRSRL